MIVAARKLANASPKRPRQAELRRAVSTAYYALFHVLAREVADLLVGVGQNRPDRAWAQVYRALQHGEAKNACIQVGNLGFSGDIIDLAKPFVALQELRHRADYDPEYRLQRADAITAIELAEGAMERLKSATRKERRAFAVLLIFKRR